MNNEAMIKELAEAEVAHQVTLNQAIIEVVDHDPKGYGSAAWKATAWAWATCEDVAQSAARLKEIKTRFAQMISNDPTKRW